MPGDVEFTRGVARGDWPEFAFVSEHEHEIREEARLERAALGLPAKTIIDFERST